MWGMFGRRWLREDKVREERFRRAQVNSGLWVDGCLAIWVVSGDDENAYPRNAGSPDTPMRVPVASAQGE